MRSRLLLVPLLCTPILAACGVSDWHSGDAAAAGGSALDTPDARQHRAEQMADLLLALGRAAGRPYGTTGWAGSWTECVSYTGHQVEFRGSGSFDAEVDGLQPKRAVLDAVRASGWRVTGVRINARHLSFDLAGDGVRGSFSATDSFVQLEVGIGCTDVSAEDARRLEAAGSVDHTR